MTEFEMTLRGVADQALNSDSELERRMAVSVLIQHALTERKSYEIAQEQREIQAAECVCGSTTNQGEATMKKAANKERAVLVTTEHRGVFFGYSDKTSGKTINLKRARNCVYWDKMVRGFLGLAATGPNAACRIGPPADIELRGITCVAEVTADAVKAWEIAPWS